MGCGTSSTTTAHYLLNLNTFRICALLSLIFPAPFGLHKSLLATSSPLCSLAFELHYFRNSFRSSLRIRYSSQVLRYSLTSIFSCQYALRRLMRPPRLYNFSLLLFLIDGHPLCSSAFTVLFRTRRVLSHSLCLSILRIFRGSAPVYLGYVCHLRSASFSVQS